jgi:hypothetical protein
MFEFEVYVDDSGTDSQTPVAVAACYVSSTCQWREFSRNWSDVLKDEGFDEFHMANFVAKPSARHEPFCSWDNAKKDRVYRRLAGIINLRTRRGFAVAIPKKAFDEYALPEFRKTYASNNYIWAVKTVFALLEEWRKEFAVSKPLQYVFDRDSSRQQRELKKIWDDYAKLENARAKYGLDPNGVTFANKKNFTPLQAADILAWQMQNYMRRVVMAATETERRNREHRGFRMLRENRSMRLAFYSTEQVRKVFEDARRHHNSTGEWPWGAGPVDAHVMLTEPGVV